MNLSHLPPDVRASTSRTKALLDETDYGRAELLKPLILLAVCAPVTVILWAMIDGVTLLGALLQYIVILPILVVVNMVALFIAAAIGAVDEGGPLFLGVVRMVGVVAGMQLAWTFFDYVPLFLLGLILSFLVFAGLMEWLFDFTLGESAGLAIVLLVLQILVMISIFSLV